MTAVKVEAKLEEDGRVTPTTVTLNGRRERVADVGRQWTEAADGGPQRHVLVMLPNQDRLELALDLRTLTWRLVQTWTTPRVG